VRQGLPNEGYLELPSYLRPSRAHSARFRGRSRVGALAAQLWWDEYNETEPARRKLHRRWCSPAITATPLNVIPLLGVGAVVAGQATGHYIESMVQPQSRSTLAALTSYLLLRYHFVTPDGTFDGDCWHPAKETEQSCCVKMVKPSKSNPWVLMRHCRSAAHVYHSYVLSCSEQEFLKLCSQASRTYLGYLAVSHIGPDLRRIARSCATDTCLDLAPCYAVEAVMLEC
jgi:hypothetical protein